MPRVNKPSQFLRKIIASNYNSSIDNHLPKLIEEDEFNWTEVVDEALAFGLGPLLYAAVQEVNLTPNPAIMELLHLTYFASATQNMLVMKDLNFIVNVLTQAELRHILLKGSALFQSIYPDPALRPMLDIDFLVPFSLVDRTLNVLNSFGYSQSKLLPYHDDTGLVWNQIALSNDSEVSIPLELHWNLLDNPYYSQRISASDLWQRSIPHKMERAETRLLSKEDLVLHLCAHNVFHHLGTYHRTAVDIGFILRNGKDVFAWDRFMNYAVEYELGVAAKLTLKNAREDWYVDVPEYIISELNRFHLRKRERFFLIAQGSEILKVLRTFITIPGLRSKLRFVLRQLFPSREYMNWRYSLRSSIPLPVAYIYRYLIGMTNLLLDTLGAERTSP